jgi:hypothetical protein
MWWGWADVYPRMCIGYIFLQSLRLYTMAMTPEAKVKNQVKKYLKEFGPDLYHFFPATGGYGRNGVPDVVGCYRGRFFAIECKTIKGKLTMLQELELNKIWAAQGGAWVVNEYNVANVPELIRALGEGVVEDL